MQLVCWRNGSGAGHWHSTVWRVGFGAHFYKGDQALLMNEDQWVLWISTQREFSQLLLTHYLIGSLGMKRNKTKPLPTKGAQFTRGDKHVKDPMEHRMRLLALWFPPKHAGFLLPNIRDTEGRGGAWQSAPPRIRIAFLASSWLRYNWHVKLEDRIDFGEVKLEGKWKRGGGVLVCLGGYNKKNYKPGNL